MLEFRLPQFGMGMTDGTILRWFKAEGEAITAGEPLVEIEAAKTTVEVDAPKTGVLARILVPKDQNVPVNTPIAVIADAGEALTGDIAPAENAPQEEAEEPSAAREEADAPPSSPLARRTAALNGIDIRGVEGSGARGKVVAADIARAVSHSKVQIEPRARRAARQLGIDLAEVPGTGPGGRIIEEDVRAFAALPAPAPQPTPSKALAFSSGTLEKHSMMRRTIARRLTESKQTVPHFYLRATCAVDALIELRAELNALQSGIKVSLNDLIVRAVARALKDTPGANLSYHEEGMLHHKGVDIAVAVATPRGLVTPVVRDADEKTILALSAEIRELAERGRQGKLAPEEYEGGSSSVSNLGMYGTEEFAAIINPPQASIFAIGAVEERPVVRGGAVVPALVMTVTLSVDHRAIDGAVAAQLLATFKRYIEKPTIILI